MCGRIGTLSDAETSAMSEDLLSELETAPSVAGSLDNVEDLVRVVVPEAGWALQRMKGYAPTFENAWRRIVVDVARGQTAQIQAVPVRLLNAFEKRLGLLRATHALAVGLANLGRSPCPDAEVLLPEIAGMTRLKANVFDRWQTAADLEDLAARDYPLTTSELDRLGPHQPPPASL